jgi:hypothetical protein
MLSHVISYGLAAAARAGEKMGADPAIVTFLKWAHRGFAIGSGIGTIQDRAREKTELGDPPDSTLGFDLGDIGFGD